MAYKKHFAVLKELSFLKSKMIIITDLICRILNSYLTKLIYRILILT